MHGRIQGGSSFLIVLECIVNIFIQTHNPLELLFSASHQLSTGLILCYPINHFISLVPSQQKEITYLIKGKLQTCAILSRCADSSCQQI